MKIKYVAIFSENVPEEADFLKTVLGFKNAGYIMLRPGMNCELVSLDNDEVIFIIIPKSCNIKEDRLIILNTENCIEEYHKIIKKGGLLNNKPYYHPNGLFAEFTDKEGNHFILIEERVYSE